MYYYQHHIGDFDRATRHLSRIERSVYLDMIFMYYETEAALPLDIVALCRKIVARTEEEKAAVLAVLDEFFHETPCGWFHDRCEEELADYRKKSSQASDAGKRSAEVRAERRQAAMGKNPTGVERRGNGNPTTVQRPFNDRSTDDQRTVNEPSTEAQREANEPSTNHKPLTNNHKPVTKEVKTIVPPVGATGSEDVQQVFAYWQQQRGHDRAKLDDKRAKAIKARLKDGYTVGDLCRAVDGIARSAHHMGQNDSRTVYDDIELICRTAVNVDKFAKLSGEVAGGMSPGLRAQVDILQEWAGRE